VSEAINFFLSMILKYFPLIKKLHIATANSYEYDTASGLLTAEGQ